MLKGGISAAGAQRDVGEARSWSCGVFAHGWHVARADLSQMFGAKNGWQAGDESQTLKGHDPDSIHNLVPGRSVWRQGGV